MTTHGRVETLARTPRDEVGTVLMLEALVDFAFLSQSPPWPSDELRAKQWFRAFGSWTALRRTMLSLEAIDDYLDERHPL